MYQITSHFLEIRLRTIYFLLSLILTVTTSYYYQFEVLYIIGLPFLDLNQKFILIDLTEAFYTILKICGIISFFIIFPFFFYHLWSFYIPSRYFFERKTINKFSIIFFFLLIIEILVLYFFLFPRICDFLLSFEIISSTSNLPIKDLQNNTEIEFTSLNNAGTTQSFRLCNSLGQSPEQELTNVPLINIKLTTDLSDRGIDIFEFMKKSINEFLFYEVKNNKPILLELTARLESYVNLTSRFYFIMLTIFQIPFIVFIFSYYNIIDCYVLCKIRKYFLFFSLLVSALISPPDIISQSIIAIFLFFFYEFLLFIGIFFSFLRSFLFNE